MNRYRAALIALLLPAAGAGLGHLAAPHLAHTNYTVRLAARVWREEREKSAQRTLQSEAFRLTGGADKAALFARARRVLARFRVGTTLLGAWFGLVVGLKVLTLAAPASPARCEVDQAWCVSCGRCYRWCPREQRRLQEAGAGGTGAPGEAGGGIIP